jgi:hypothetical protein
MAGKTGCSVDIVGVAAVRSIKYQGGDFECDLGLQYLRPSCRLAMIKRKTRARVDRFFLYVRNPSRSYQHLILEDLCMQNVHELGT